jgi:tRNA G18 (ribose-2'-O)-methylase SpoU
MAQFPIGDLDDPRIAIYRSLKTTNATRSLDQFVVEGEKLVARLLESQFPIVSVLVTERYFRATGVRMPDEIPIYVLPHELIDRLVGFPFHRGVLACAQRRPSASTEEIIRPESESSFIVICPKLSDPENLGAITRIGDVFGIDGLMTGPECPDPFSRRVLRVSMGSVLRVPIIVSSRLADEVDRLIKDFGLCLHSLAIPFDQIARPRRLGLVLGDEDQGIDETWLAKCHHGITIPMRKNAGSLNVAVAAGILIHGLT